MGESGKDAIRVGFDGSLKLEPACRQAGLGNPRQEETLCRIVSWEKDIRKIAMERK